MFVLDRDFFIRIFWIFNDLLLKRKRYIFSKTFLFLINYKKCSTLFKGKNVI